MLNRLINDPYNQDKVLKFFSRRGKSILKHTKNIRKALSYLVRGNESYFYLEYTDESIENMHIEMCKAYLDDLNLYFQIVRIDQIETAYYYRYESQDLDEIAEQSKSTVIDQFCKNPDCLWLLNQHKNLYAMMHYRLLILDLKEKKEGFKKGIFAFEIVPHFVNIFYLKLQIAYERFIKKTHLLKTEIDSF